MFTSHTLLSLYADARRADDLRAARASIDRTAARRPSWLARLVARPAVVAPLPIVAGR